MTHLRLLGFLAVLAGMAGCAGRLPAPLSLAGPKDPAATLAVLTAYNAEPAAIRVGGALRAKGRGSVDFGASAERGAGLRLDAVAGPFSTLVLSISCRSEMECRAYVPAKQRVYVDQGASWERLLGPLLRGRVPTLATPTGAWSAEGGESVLFLAENGWQERIEFDPGGSLPARVFVGREGAAPDLVVVYGEFQKVQGRPFPGRVQVQTAAPEASYEVTFRRVEPVSAIDPGVLRVPTPPGTMEESARGNATWEQTGIPLWFPAPNGPEK